MMIAAHTMVIFRVAPPATFPAQNNIFPGRGALMIRERRAAFTIGHITPHSFYTLDASSAATRGAYIFACYPAYHGRLFITTATSGRVGPSYAVDHADFDFMKFHVQE